ncbi:MAG TPA: HNH endonuclease [Blastocatellia bacterium]|nr:HNH endonuclease [Blastocatellia bacterium]
MNRKQFIESQGATCRNWRFSWSFINESKKIIIFGAWDKTQSGKKSLILSEEWKISRKGRKQPAYAQSREHIRLAEEEGYRLMTFPMVYSGAYEEGPGPAKIESFKPTLASKTLIRIGSCWYASDDEVGLILAEELAQDEKLIEGAAKSVAVNSYERNPVARARCLEHHGYSCTVCSFSFESFYGPVGKNYIHVHHLVPLSETKGEYVVDPVNDLVPVCPNCHAMIHSTRPARHIDQLKKHLENRETDT